jgi:hypothetical protein
MIININFIRKQKQIIKCRSCENLFESILHNIIDLFKNKNSQIDSFSYTSQGIYYKIRIYAAVGFIFFLIHLVKREIRM